MNISDSTGFNLQPILKFFGQLRTFKNRAVRARDTIGSNNGILLSFLRNGVQEIAANYQTLQSFGFSAGDLNTALGLATPQISPNASSFNTDISSIQAETIQLRDYVKANPMPFRVDDSGTPIFDEPIDPAFQTQVTSYLNNIINLLGG